MENKQRGMVEIKLDKVNLGIKTVRTFLWAGLLHEDKTITEEMIGDMVDFENMEYVQTKIAEAFELANRKNA